MPLQAEEQFTFQMAGARERKVSDRTSRSPCGPVRQVGAAGVDVALLDGALLVDGAAADVVGAPAAAR